MTTISESRQQQLSPGLAIKTPCRAASTGVLVLSGEQTVDGIAVVDGDRVLVKDQASAVDNGIYTVSTGAWSRAPDFDGNRDIVRGTIVRVNEGSTTTGVWLVSSADPILIGTSAITFSQDVVAAANIGNDSVTYAKIQNISATDKMLGRATAGAGDTEEIPVTAAGRAILDDADATAQRATLGLGTLATQNGTFSGTSSGNNTGDQSSVSGNAGTASALQTARTINGVSFDGTANIVLAATGSNVLKLDAAAVGNVNAGPDDLITYSLPADTLDANGKGIRVTMWGTGANNVNGKVLGIAWGSTSRPLALTISEAVFWKAEIIVVRTASGNQDVRMTFQETLEATGGGTLNTVKGSSAQYTATEADSAPIVIKAVADLVTATNDVVQEGLLVEQLI